MDHDLTAWEKIGFGITLAVIAFVWVHRIITDTKKRQLAMEKAILKEEVEVKMTGDAKQAISTLVQWGYDKKDATNLVQKAVATNPDGDCQILIQTAVRK